MRKISFFAAERPTIFLTCDPSFSLRFGQKKEGGCSGILAVSQAYSVQRLPVWTHQGREKEETHQDGSFFPLPHTRDTTKKKQACSTERERKKEKQG